MQRFIRCLGLLVLMACGPRPSSSLNQIPADSADNTPVKSQCFALGRSLDAAVPVEYDDQAEVRLCANVQKDGQLGLDLRFRPSQMPSGRMAALVVVRNTQGVEARRMFRLEQDPLTADYALNLSQGCLVGKPGGCARMGTPSMHELLAPIQSQEGAIGFKPFVFEVTFIDLMNSKLQAPELDSLARQSAYKVSLPAL